MRWRLIPVAAAIGLAFAIPAHAAAQGAGSTIVAQAQTHQNKFQKNQQNKPKVSVQQQNRQHYTTQSRNRVQVTRGLKIQNPPAIQRRYDWNQYRQGRTPPDWTQHRRFNPRDWQRNFHAQNRFHWRRYNRPQGWYYRRWVFGMVLPTLFWSRDYWIDDYWQFGLMNPPYGYVWVRYGDDALLVNVQTGLILRVVYGVFY